MKQSTIKRIIDIIVSGFMLVILSPILAITALAISIESKGFPLFFQDRVGKDTNLFRIVKFRSMVIGADKIGTLWTQVGDKRITKIGKFIRKTSIDELPQLWNVFIGDMSLVGPRPILASDEQFYTPSQWKNRHSIRSGITGLAQVNGRSSLNIEQQIAYDCEYAKNCSIAMDISIIFKTILIVFKRSGTN